MFYTYHQNNSGGHFFGPIVFIVEADSASEANEIAQKNDVYFDGVRKGIDCECCGDRWYRQWEDGGTEIPESYGEEIKESKECKIIYKKLE